MNEQLKADSNDRPVSSKPKNDTGFKLSRQHIMILIAIIILLLLVLGINSVLSPHSQPQTKEVAWKQNETTAATEVTTQNHTTLEPTQLQPPAIAEVTTQSHTPPVQSKERVEIPGEVTDALVRQIQPVSQPEVSPQRQSEIKPEIKVENKPKAEVSHETKSEHALTSGLPATHFTIQISASSNRNNLIAYAKKYDLVHYSVYETRRDNKAWFVLIVGNYKTTAEAKNAISMLPKEIQQQKPWVKSGARIQEEQRLKK